MPIRLGLACIMPSASLRSEPFATVGPRLVNPANHQPGLGLEIEVDELLRKPFGADRWNPAGELPMIGLSVRNDPSGGVEMTASGEFATRQIRSVEDVKGLLADHGESLTERQYHGLGIVTAVIALHQFADQYGSDQLGKVLDTFYFQSRDAPSSQALSRGMGEATFALRRTNNLATTVDELLAEAQRDFAS